jgi:hypothetical protein
VLSLITTGAYELDRWLKTRVGRLYTIVLASSLGMGIAASASVIVSALGTGFPAKGGLAALGAAAVQTVLLVNQLAQLHEYRQMAGERRAARRARKAQRRAQPGVEAGPPTKKD